MTTEASLKIRVDSSEVKNADRSLDDLAKSGDKADGSSKKLTESTGKLSSAARLAATAFSALAVSYGVREIVQASDAWQSAANQLRLVTNGASDLAKTQSALMKVSNDTRSSFESTANLYTRLTRATSEMGLTQTELLGITDTINKSFAVSGATATEAAAAITQLSQGLAAGALRGDEFNSVSEQAPGIMRAIAESLNMTIGELRAFAAEGGITSEIVVTALQGAADSIDNEFSKSVRTFGQSMTVAKNNMLEFVGGSDAVTSTMSTAGMAAIRLSESLTPVSNTVSDIATVLWESLNPAIADTEFFIRALGAGFSDIGESLSTAKTGFATLDEVMNAFFGNANSGAVSMIEIFQLAFGTVIPNTVAVVQTGTIAIADAYQRLKVIITKSGQEEIDALKLLDNARATSVAEVINNKDAQLNALYELISRQAEARKSVKDLIESQDDLNDSVDDFVGPMRKAIKLTAEQKKEIEKANEKTQDFIQSLREKLTATEMDTRAAAIYNAVLKAGTNATSEQIVEATTLAARIYDLEVAHDSAADSAKELEKASDTAAKEAEKSWRKTHDYLSGAFVDIMNNGGNAFDNIAKAFERTVQRMVAEWAASGLMGLFTGQGTSGFSMPSFGGGGSGGGGGLGNLSSLASAGGTAAQFLGGLSGSSAVAGTASFVGPVAPGLTAGGLGASIGGALSSAGSAAMSMLQAIPGWGWALGGAALAAKLLDDSGTMSGNAGMLIRPVGDGDRQFDVPAFASGFDPVGFARREDQGAATQVIDVFRADDAVLTALAKASGIDVSYSANQFGGFNEKGTGSGLFFGTANEDGKNTAVSIEQQRTQFVSQWLKGLSGQVDSSLISDALGAGSADAMIARAAQLAGIDGSHANGLDYVPFDGYRAQLHRGERVQTAAEARADDAGSGSFASMANDLKAIRQELNTIRLNTGSSANILDKWDGQGMPAEAA
ncbi:MAG: tape measure protein [Candidatus Paceibacterota bacterium]|jgi:tape measure domain-containing protein